MTEEEKKLKKDHRSAVTLLREEIELLEALAEDILSVRNAIGGPLRHDVGGLDTRSLQTELGKAEDQLRTKAVDLRESVEVLEGRAVTTT